MNTTEQTVHSRPRRRTLALSTAFIESDPVGSLRAAGQIEALVTYIALISIVREAGCYVRADEALFARLAAATTFSAGRLRADIGAIVAAGFFDAAIYAAFGVLTSRRLQSAYRRRKDAQAIPEELLIPAACRRRRRRHSSAAPSPAPHAPESAAPSAVETPEAATAVAQAAAAADESLSERNERYLARLFAGSRINPVCEKRLLEEVIRWDALDEDHTQTYDGWLRDLLREAGIDPDDLDPA